MDTPAPQIPKPKRKRKVKANDVPTFKIVYATPEAPIIVSFK